MGIQLCSAKNAFAQRDHKTKRTFTLDLAVSTKQTCANEDEDGMKVDEDYSDKYSLKGETWG